MRRPERSEGPSGAAHGPMSRKLAALVTTVFATISGAAGVDEAEAIRGSEPLLADNPYYVPYAIVKEGTAWKNPLIFVCWEDSAAPYPVERSIVENAVADSWGSEKIVVFSGWQPCALVNYGIRVGVADVRPVAKGLGNELNKVPNGIVLNFTFQNFPLPCPSAERDACIKIIAIHEFGHALGFSHEEWQRGADERCLVERDGPPGNLSLTPWDKDSVMGGCLPQYGYRGNLSERDRAGLRKFYAARTGNQ